MTDRHPHSSPFDEVFDVAVFGAGYAGLAACRRLSRQGLRVLLVDRGGDLIWESGRALERHLGESSDPDWQGWLDHLQHRGAAMNGQIAPAAAEVLANQNLRRLPGLRVLYYVAPIAVQWRDDRLAAVLLATKSGPRRIVARRYLDATEQGELLALLPDPPAPRVPDRQRLAIYFLRSAWPDQQSHAVACPDLPGATVCLESSCWPLERCLSIELPGDHRDARAAWLPALRAARAQLHDLLDDALVTHVSVIPLPIYERSRHTPAALLPANVACAAPARTAEPCRTAAQRHDLGAVTAEKLLDQPPAAVSLNMFAAPLPSMAAQAFHRADVAIAGLGTGGLMAAVAAARQGASVLAFDPLPFAGGIGAGGGIHVYYHGVPGGLQEELNERVRQISPLFGRMAQIQGFHPDAKKLVAHAMLCEAGVTRLQGQLTAVTLRDALLHVGWVGTEAGVSRVEATHWIDATGDADLVAMADATTQLGRPTDGQLHAYSQSSGRAGIVNGVATMHCINFDAGFVDPTDAEDLTRARLEGIGHYEQARFRADDHPTTIAPAIGIRQGRLVATDYIITLADLIEGRRFSDCIGYCGCHYDNHAVDYDMESDESMFWVWVCQSWREPLRCELPYRCLLPQSLNNVWLACRGLGVSLEAHRTIRMQRDIQRIGEVAGLAAAQAAARQVDSRGIDLTLLRNQLIQSGGLKPSTTGTKPGDHAAARVQEWIAAMHDDAEPARALWGLYRAGPLAAAAELEPLLHSPDADVSWRAACVMAMWGDGRAQLRLCQALARREQGHGDAAASSRLVPRWVAALALLRICGGEDCLLELAKLAAEPDTVVNVRTLIVVACQRVLSRGDWSERTRAQVAAILELLLATTPALTVAPPQRGVLDSQLPPPPTHGYWSPRVREDIAWQMHLEIARTRIMLGQDAHAAAIALRDDPRAIVRRAARRTLEPADLSLAYADPSSSPAYLELERP